MGISTRYAKRPLFLQDTCDGCGAATDLHHSLVCALGGLVVSKHNTIRDALFELAEEAFGKSRVGNEPTIYPPGYKHPDANGQRGDVSVMGLWARAIKCIIDAVVPHAESESNLGKSPEAVVRSAQLKKKREYGAVCRARRLHFSPFAVTTSGILAPEAKALLKKFARVLADKWGQPLSVTTITFLPRSHLPLSRPRTIPSLVRGRAAALGLVPPLRQICLLVPTEFYSVGEYPGSRRNGLNVDLPFLAGTCFCLLDTGHLLL